MIQNNIVRFLSALLFLSVFSACSLREIYDLNDSENSSGRIEFVARPMGFNNQFVETKSTSNTFEKAIYSCYLLVFDNDKNSQTYGNLIQRSEASLNESFSLKAKNNSNIKACFLVNVTKDFAENIKGLNRPDGSTENPNFYLNTAVIDITYSDHTTSDSDPETKGVIGIPSVNFGGTVGTKKCLPMYGEWSGATAGLSTIEVPIKRLFSKVSVSLKMSRSDINTIENTYFDIKSYNITNLPTKVKLVESSSESDWADHISLETYPLSFTNATKSLINENKKLYNQGSSLNNFQEYAFYFYAPEYYVSPKSSTTNKPEYKPRNVDTDSKCPIFLSLTGIYTPLLGNNTNLTYDIYLGEDNTSNYNIKRNHHYTNTLTISGTTNHSTQTDESYIDHRVHADNEFDMIKLFGETANCYLVQDEGTIVFPAVKGVYKGDINATTVPWCTGNKVEIYAYDNSSISLTTPTYNPNNHEITFDVKNMANGNVVIAMYYNDNPETEAKEDEQIEWSWHFWFNSGFSILNYDAIGVTNQKYPNGNFVMNRNLGAEYTSNTVTEGLGLYYKYGSKNPYFSNKYQGGGTFGNGTWVPESGNKAINDPCPPGYTVPISTLWTAATPKHASYDFTGILGATGTLLFYDQDGVSNDAYFPYSGYLASEGASPVVTLQNIEKALTAPGYTYDWIQSSDTEYIGGWKQTTRETRVTAYASNVEYTIVGNAQIGALLHQNGTLPYTYYVLPYANVLDLRISAFDKYTVTVVTERDLTNWGGKEISKTTSQTSRVTNPARDSYSLMNEDLIVRMGLKGDINQAVYGNQCDNSHIPYNTSYGYQLRCLSESNEE